MNYFDSNTRQTRRSVGRLTLKINRRFYEPRCVVMVFVASGIAVCSFGAQPALAQTHAQVEISPVDGKRALIKSILTEQTKAWNQGNLPQFMETYWKSDRLTFSSGGKTTYGWQATLDNYKKSYSPPKQMGQLHFDGLEILMIESNSALVLGNFHLNMKDGEKRNGNFSLVVKKLESGWKIIHDHSSSLNPESD